MNHALNQCYLCQRATTRLLLSIPGNYLTKCDNCQLWKLDTRAHKHISKQDYGHVLNLPVYDKYIARLREQQYQNELENLAKLTVGKKLLDLGCAAGIFIYQARKAGYLADGVEPQRVLAKQAEGRNPKAKIYPLTVNDLHKIKKYYDTVTLWSVLEHFDDPLLALSKISSRLPGGGIIAIRTPNANGLLQNLAVILFQITGGRITGPIRTILQLDYESKHCFLFSQKSLTLILNNTGFQLIKYYPSSSMNWRHYDLWLKATNKKDSFLKTFFMKAIFFVNGSIINRFNLSDDMVVFARKISS